MTAPGDGPRQEAIRRLRQWIDDGLLPVGSPLPGERPLSVRLGLPQATVHRALVALAAEGLIGPVRQGVRLVRDPSRHATGRAGQIIILAPLRRARSAGQGFADHLSGGAHARAEALGLRSLAVDPKRIDAAAIGRLAASAPLGVVYPDAVHAPPSVPDLVARLVAAGIPCVAADGGPEFQACDRVLSDHAAGAGMLVRWLHARGRRRIVQVWNSGWSGRWWYPPRRAGYERALRALGLEPQPLVEIPSYPEVPAPDLPSQRRILGDRARSRIGWLVEVLLGADAADALMVDSDGEAFAVAGAARVLGIPPGRLDVVGYDGYADASPYAPAGEPPVASVDKRNPEVGAALVDLLLDRVSGRLPAAPQVRLFAPRLVETGPQLPAPPAAEPAAP